jgi:hypothetical protein
MSRADDAPTIHKAMELMLTLYEADPSLNSIHYRALDDQNEACFNLKLSGKLFKLRPSR